MPLAKEIWLPELMEGFYPEASFLGQSRDFSAFVENNKINLAEAGVNPNVLINNTTYPIPVSERADTPISLELDYYDTENTVLRNAEKAELSYDKRASVMFGHKQSLLQRISQKAADSWAPASHTSDTPVLTTTGGDNGKGEKRLTFEDVLRLEEIWNDLDIPEEGRILVLTTQHQTDLKIQDMKLYKQVLADKQLFDFKMFRYSKLATFNKTTGVKKPFGAAAAGTDVKASLAYHKDEVMRCDGETDMFSKEKDPEQRGDVIGFQKRALALPIRNKTNSSIYSPAV